MAARLITLDKASLNYARVATLDVRRTSRPSIDASRFNGGRSAQNDVLQKCDTFERYCVARARMRLKRSRHVGTVIMQDFVMQLSLVRIESNVID